MCLTGRDTQKSGYNNRRCSIRDGEVVGQLETWCVSYFRNAWEETYWSGHLNLIRTSGLRGARQSLSTLLAAVVQKIYLLLRPTTPFFFSFFPPILFVCFLPAVKRKSHLHQGKLLWAALSVQETWGFDSSHSTVINYFSTVVGSPLPLCELLQWRWWWLEATHDKCCPYYWPLWEEAQVVLD